MTATGASLSAARRGETGRFAVFIVLVIVVLTFTQAWVMPLLGPDSDPDADGSAFVRLLYLPSYALCLGLLATAPGRFFTAVGRTPALAALLVLAALSTVWSIAPDVTARRVLAVLFTSLAGYLLATRYGWAGVMQTCASALALVVVASFGLALFAPSYGRMTTLFPGAWRGVFFEKNGLGNAMSLSAMIFLAASLLNPKLRALWASFAGLAILLVLLSQSKTSLIALFAGLGALSLALVARRGPAWAVAAVFVAVTVLLAAGVLLMVGGDAALTLLGKDATLTGRTRLWSAIWPEIQARPWTGYGYGAVWTDTGLWGPQAWITKRAGFQATHAHDSWLDVWINVGFGGVALLMISYGASLMRALASIFRPGPAYCAFPFLVAYGVLTSTETVGLVYNDVVWLMFVALTVRLAIPARASTDAAP